MPDMDGLELLKAIALYLIGLSLSGLLLEVVRIIMLCAVVRLMFRKELKALRNRRLL